MARHPTEKEYAYERLGDRFAESLSQHDTQRRVSVLVDDFLTDPMIRGKNVLDVGCGLGFFSQRLVQRGAKVIATDISPLLVRRTVERVGCEGEVADVLQLADHFGLEQFDAVVSSECIEHVPDPNEALRQMVKVVKPGGVLSISTPNMFWYPAVRLATLLRLRPFHGHENFSWWSGIGGTLEESGTRIIREYGLHLVPFRLAPRTLLTWCDSHLQALRCLMINICVLAQKPSLDPAISDV